MVWDPVTAWCNLCCWVVIGSITRHHIKASIRILENILEGFFFSLIILSVFFFDKLIAIFFVTFAALPKASETGKRALFLFWLLRVVEGMYWQLFVLPVYRAVGPFAKQKSMHRVIIGKHLWNHSISPELPNVHSLRDGFSVSEQNTQFPFSSSSFLEGLLEAGRKQAVGQVNTCGSLLPPAFFFRVLQSCCP